MNLSLDFDEVAVLQENMTYLHNTLEVRLIFISSLLSMSSQKMYSFICLNMYFIQQLLYCACKLLYSAGTVELNTWYVLLQQTLTSLTKLP